MNQVTISPSDPQWAVELKQKLNEIILSLAGTVIVGDGISTLVKKGVVTAISQWTPVEITGAKDGDGYYECSVYLGDSESAAPLVEQKLLMRGHDVDDTDTQGYYVAQRLIIDGDQVWEVITGLPALPDLVNNYALCALAGVVQWVSMGPCTTAA